MPVPVVPNQDPPVAETPGRLFIVDDDPEVARVLERFFHRDGWTTTTFLRPSAALAAVEEMPVDVVLTDLTMPEMDGLELTRALRSRGVEAPVLLITAYGTIDHAVNALKQGAFDYLTKPFDLEQVRSAVRRAYLHRQLQSGAGSGPGAVATSANPGGLIGDSPGMQEVYSLIERTARSQATVLILGESGSGKELVARAIHARSSRARAKFVAVSCAALPTELLESELFGHEKGAFTGANYQRLGRFELAHGGTLFLDEIGDISQTVQAKLLRVLQEREIDRVGGTRPIPVDVRLVSATNRDLPTAIAQGDFRADLFYRLNVIEIRLPPLRERRGDIRLLARHVLARLNVRDRRSIHDLSDAAWEALEAYDWPGNVRELEHALEAAFVLAPDGTTQLTAEHLPAPLRRPLRSAPSPADGARPTSLADRLAAVERELLLEALHAHRWNLAATAAGLQVSPSTAAYLVRKHRLVHDQQA